MKTLKSMAVALSLFIAFNTAKANNNIKDDRTKTAATALETYVDAIGYGNVQNLDQVVDASAKFSMLRGKDVVSFSRSEMLGQISQAKGHEQNCRIRTTIVNSGNEVTIARVDMRYANFVRSNYITLTNIGDSWKITNVYSVFN